MAVSPFHRGEIEAQRRAGYVLERAPIRATMPESHRDFFASLSFLLLAAMNRDGFPTASILTGSPGFVSSSDPHTLQIAALPRIFLAVGDRVGLLGIDFSTGRRNRANGRVCAIDAERFVVAIEQSFGNCAKYIQARDLATNEPSEPGGIEHHEGLDDEASQMIAAADTLFVASCSGLDPIEHGGVDLSHRGGRPGFVGVEGNRLTIPDFPGNRYFNTLGNFLVHPKAALLFIDFTRGDLLHLSGTVRIDWVRPDFTGAQQSWQLEVQGGWRQRHALPLRWGQRAPASSLATDAWSDKLPIDSGERNAAAY